MMKKFRFATLLVVVCFAVSCKKETIRQIDTTYNPMITAEKFTNPTQLTNPYFPAELGKKFIYEGQTEDGLERIIAQRVDEPKTIMGIPCVAINVKEYLAGKLIEDTDDWFAQDNEGNVWYFGEAVDNFNSDGSLKDHHGAWEAGVDGAKPGIIMPANPQVGQKYRQEYYFNEAEDEAEVIALGVSVTVPAGTFDNCVKTKDFTALEPDALEHKFYAPGVGLIKELNVEDNEEVVLIKIEE